MRRYPRILLALALLAGLLPLAAAAADEEVVCPTAEDYKPAPLAFDAPTFIDRNRAGGEPVSIVAQDGSISVSAHAGTTHIYKDPNAGPGYGDFAVGYANQTLNWRSTDGGKTWKYVGLVGVDQGPHSATSTGFSDPDFAMDAGGRIYNVEIDLANVAVFSSNDDGQSYSRATPVAASGDRPWLTGLATDEVFLYVNLPKSFWRSTDGGLTYSLLPTPPINSKAYADPLNPLNGMIGPVGKTGIAITANDGSTWTTYQGADLGINDSIGEMAVDRAGNAYQVAAGGYAGPSDTTANGMVTYNYFDRETLSWGETAVTIDTPEGDALWPWLVGGDEGNVAFAWYQTLKGKPDEFYIYAAYTKNGTGTTVTCSDGSTEFIPPQFQVTNASGRPVHIGDICLSGTACNAATSPQGGDRRLGDFFTINFDHAGSLFIASGDTTLKNPLNGPKPVGNPIFIKQSGGDKMLTEPDTSRPTRPLCVHPAC